MKKSLLNLLSVVFVLMLSTHCLAQFDEPVAPNSRPTANEGEETNSTIKTVGETAGEERTDNDFVMKNGGKR